MKKMVIILLMIGVQSNLISAFGQSDVKKYYDKNGKEKIVKSIKKGVANYYTREDGMGMGPFLTSFEEIPSIGIACFNVNSKEYKHVRKSSRTSSQRFGNRIYTTKTTTSTTTRKDLTQSQGNEIANIIHYGDEEIKKVGAYQKMNAVFTSKGVQLMTPYHFLADPSFLKNPEGEYVVDEEKLNYYLDFEPEKTKVFGKILSRGSVDASALGYAPLVLSEAVTADWKTKNSYGYDLTNKMGVTAMMLVEIDLVVEKKYVGLKSIRVAVVGKNPTPYEEDKKYIKQLGGYPKGQVYFDSTLDFGDKGLSFIKLKGENVLEESFDGFDEIMECFALAITEYWEEMIEKHKKKVKK
jgi:hypothetical protein